MKFNQNLTHEMLQEMNDIEVFAQSFINTITLHINTQ